jgi:pimeloyl-ACP methyl ester carboxylesterase
MIRTKQIDIPIKLGNEIKAIKAQIFGTIANNYIPILCLHGYLDNSNSKVIYYFPQIFMKIILKKNLRLKLVYLGFKPISKYICNSNKYYMIAIDLLGQGLSCHLQDPLLYNFKTFIYSIRCVINYLNLKKYIIFGHSMGKLN